ncbi:MAG: ABC transporter ATP-binding protein [Clostridia bacterium]|nr:ABC transporter ATP-binding protein [Clostridia bacterium]
MPHILECKGLVKRFGKKEALAGIDLVLEPGRIVGLLGPNGSGKTTLIKLINGLLVPTEGTIRIGGFPPSVESKRLISYLPEHTYLSDWMRVRDLFAFFKDFYTDFNLNKAEDMLQRLSIAPGDRIKTLSKGNKEKVQLILVMSREAQLYLLDEPIGGVDPAARDYILSTILSNYSESATVLISTHLIADVERVLDHIVFIREGKILRSEQVDTLREQEGKSVDAVFREVFKC